MHKDILGLTLFIIIFLAICLSSMIGLFFVFLFILYIDDLFFNNSGPVIAFILAFFMVFGYPILQLISVYLLGRIAMKNKKNKYFSALFANQKIALKIFFILLTFDLAVGIIFGYNYETDRYDLSSIFSYLLYVLYVAPSLRFLGILLIPYLNKNPETTDA